MLQAITDKLESQIHQQLSQSGIMFRLFSRVKTLSSLHHKIHFKDEGYKSGKLKVQDMIGLRIVLYFQDDVDALAFFYSCGEVVRSSIDSLDSSTFRPQRLNLTCNLPTELVDDFRKALPEEFASYVDATYEIQIRTIFSEGWHEVEHDLRYKCKEDWEGCESYSRVLNGVIATLETAEWNMKSLFDQMARTNLLNKNYRAMLRNKMHLRIKGKDFSDDVNQYLLTHPHVAESILNTDRFVIILSLLNHQKPIELTYDNLLFFINRIEMNDADLRNLESDDARQMLDNFFA
ncbi:MAG: GTP pyrophosphokinase [Bacteroidaceae bacterium]|nr:GTP pyrophosphokinase [Bacteroidaceae bacterium]